MWGFGKPRLRRRVVVPSSLKQRNQFRHGGPSSVLAPPAFDRFPLGCN